MTDPWRIYFDGLRLDRDDAHAVEWARDDAFRRRAHEAYRTTANALTAEGWDPEDALVLTRGFGAEVQAWLESGAADRDLLRRRLEAHWQAWREHGGPSVEHRP